MPWVFIKHRVTSCVVYCPEPSRQRLQLHGCKQLQGCQRPFPAVVSKKVKDLLDKRNNMFLTPLGLVSNLLDVKYRGQQQSDEERAQAITYLFGVLVPKLSPTSVPKLELISDCIEGRGVFTDVTRWQGRGRPSSVWATVYGTTALAQVGTMIC